MTGTVSTPTSRAARASRAADRQRAGLELALLLAAITIFVIGVATAGMGRLAAAADVTDPRTGRGPIVLTAAPAADRLAAALTTIADPRERAFVAGRVADALTGAGGAAPLDLDQVGDLATLRIESATVDARRDLPALRARLARVREGRVNPATLRLLDAEDVRALRHASIVRSSGEFLRHLGLSALLLIAAFALAHGVRRLASAGGDPLLLPITALLCSLGFLTMVGVNDPWRDRLLFESFTGGVVAGCVLLAGMSVLDFRAIELHRFAFVFLGGALVLSVLLLLFGSGPGTSGVKVNLFGVQPVEAIRPLVALFLAGYFARRWELLRELRDRRVATHPVLARFRLPRIADLVPVAAGMGLVLLFFFFQRDLGPALVLSCVFLVVYSVARDRWALAAVGLAVLVGGFTAGFAAGYPSTVVKRIEMWQSPWDNAVAGGDQIAHALWGLAAGGLTGSGLGENGPEFIPTGENDLVLASLGESLGFVGLAIVLVLFGVFIVRTLRIAGRTDEPYIALLVVGLVTSLVAQLLLIAGGLLGLLPLSGVVTPFLSLGRSSMASNLAVVGLLLAASRQAPPATDAVFAPPVRRIGLVLIGLLAVLAGRAFSIQGIGRDETMGRAVRTRQGDGVLRAQENPRLRDAAALITRGTISDRHGLPLAITARTLTTETGTSIVWVSAPATIKAVEQAGLSAKTLCPDPRLRCYPFRGATYHLLGDATTRTNWGAPNAAFVERDLDSRLRGYASHAELVPLWDRRRTPAHPDVKAILDRPRDVQLTIDGRLQSRAAELLAARLASLSLTRGAIVVLDVLSGDVLASVSAPTPSMRDGRVAPQEIEGRADLPLLDRPRYGQYAPGSTFKLVTAAAALRSARPVAEEHFMCRPLPDGRVGAQIEGWRRPVRDDVTDRSAHGDVALDEGLRVSCNAYFAQLGLAVGARGLKETAAQFEIQVASPDTAERLRGQLPWASYGQAEVVATPFRMARVAATFAAGGVMPTGRWIVSPGEAAAPGRRILEAAAAERVARSMRAVVTSGTASALMGGAASDAAGKTGTAEVAGAPSHSWFVGFAPASGPRRIAFAVIVENGGYGARAAVPLAGEVVSTAKSLGIIP